MSSPAKASTNAGGSGWPRSVSAASRRPAAHPSVRVQSRRPTSGSSSMPLACSSAADSSSVNARSASRISVSAPSTRRRPIRSAGSIRVEMTRRRFSGGWRSSRSRSSRTGESPSSCRSSSTSTTGVRELVERVDQRRDGDADVLRRVQRERRGGLAGAAAPEGGEHPAPEAAPVGVRRVEREPAHRFRARALRVPGAQQRALARAGARGEQGDRPAQTLLERLGEPGPLDPPRRRPRRHELRRAERVGFGTGGHFDVCGKGGVRGGDRVASLTIT